MLQGKCRALTLLFCSFFLSGTILAAEQSKSKAQLEDARQSSNAQSSSAENSAVQAGKVFQGSVDHGNAALLRYRGASGDGGFSKTYSKDIGSPLFSQQAGTCPDGAIEVPGGGCTVGEDVTPEECKELAEKAKKNFLLSLLAFLAAAGLIGAGLALRWTGVGLGLAMAGTVALMGAGGLAVFQASKSKANLKENAACGLEEKKTGGIGADSSGRGSTGAEEIGGLGGEAPLSSGSQKLGAQSCLDRYNAAKKQCDVDFPGDDQLMDHFKCVYQADQDCRKCTAANCKADEIYFGGKCVKPCPDGKTPQDANGKCPCGKGTYDPKAACCSSGKILTGFIFVNNQCTQLCPDGKTPQDAKGNCPCGRQTYNPKKACCSGGKAFEGMVPIAGGKCGCPANQIQIEKGKCVAKVIPPKAPPGVDMEKNIAEASKHKFPLGLTWFKEHVQNKGHWDYKQQGKEYRDFGNFHYGVVGKAAGIPEWLLLRMAGWAQRKAGTSDSKWGNPWWKPPYGDDPADQAMIEKGFQYYKQRQIELGGK